MGGKQINEQTFNWEVKEDEWEEDHENELNK